MMNPPVWKVKKIDILHGRQKKAALLITIMTAFYLGMPAPTVPNPTFKQEQMKVTSLGDIIHSNLF